MGKERVKGFVSGIIASALVLGLAGTAAATVGARTLNADFNDIKVSLNGQQLGLTDANGQTVEPFAVEGTTYLPVRAVGEALGLSVDWDASTNTVTIYDAAGTLHAMMTEDAARALHLYVWLESVLEIGSSLLDGAQWNMAYVGSVSPYEIDEDLDSILSDLTSYESRLQEVNDAYEELKNAVLNKDVENMLTTGFGPLMANSMNTVDQIEAAIYAMKSYNQNPNLDTFDLYTSADTTAFEAVSNSIMLATSGYTDMYQLLIETIYQE